MKASYSVSVSKVYENCSFEEACTIVNLFSGGDSYEPSITMRPEENSYGEFKGTYYVVLDGLGVGLLQNKKDVLHFAGEAFDHLKELYSMEEEE